MNSIELRKYPDPATLARAASADWFVWLQDARQAKAGRDRIRVALSGGRITKDFFVEVARTGKDLKLYQDVHFFWADERCVPPTDPESNFAMAQELLFKPLGISDGQIHRLRGEQDEAAGLREAIAAVNEGTPRANGQPVLDLVHLGMGEDGHTASLFPGEPVEVMNDPAVYRLVTAVKPPPRRLTLGYGAIAAAQEVWVLVSGKGKEAALQASLSPQGATPLGRVLQLRTNTRIYTDVA